MLWPGYVASMASLLLSLLLLLSVLIMTIVNIGNISESYLQAIARIGFGSGQDIGSLAQLSGIADNAPGKATPAKEIDASPPPRLDSTQILSAQFHSARFGRRSSASTPDAAGSSDQPLVLDLGTANFDREAAKQAAALAAQDQQLLTQVDLSKVDIRKIKFNNLDFSGVTLHRGLTPQQMSKVDFSGVDFAGLSPDRVKKIKPFLAKEAIIYQLELLKTRPKVIAKPKPDQAPAPVAPIPPIPTTVPAVTVPAQPPALTADHYRIVFTEETTELNRTQKQQFLTWTDSIKATGEQVRIWTEVPAGDDFLQRSALARLQMLRTWLIDAGVTADRVRIALQNAGTAPIRDLTLHIELQKR